MKHSNGRMTLCILSMAVFAVFSAGCGGEPAPETKTSSDPALISGAAAPVTVDGLAALLNASKGKVAVINFWATWCPPCVVEMPELAKFYRSYSAEDVALHAVSLDLVEDMETIIKPFLEENGVPFPVHVLSERDIEMISKVVKAEISGALPVTLIYDRSGKLVEMWEGGITLEDLNQLVKPLL